MKKPFDLVIHEHNGEDSLSINFEDRKAVLSWEDEAGSRTCDKVIWAIDRVFAAYDGKRPSVESAQEELNMINKRIDELEEALLGLIGESSHVAEVLMGDLIKQAKQAQRVVDLAGYTNDEELLADFMQSKAGKETIVDWHKKHGLDCVPMGKAGNE